MNLLEWSPLEVVAAAFGVISVYLSTRQNIWSWPTAIVNVALYAVVFYQGRLYGQMGLQPIYLALSIYGWYEWLHGGEQRTELLVSSASPRLMATVLALDLVAWLEPDLPFLDPLRRLLERTQEQTR